MKDAAELFDAVAHEVKTPLAVLRGYAELLAGGRAQVREEAVPAILAAVERLGPAVDDLLTILEIELGAVEPERERVDVAVLAGDGFESAWVFGDSRLLARALGGLRQAATAVHLNTDDGRVTIVADGFSAPPPDLYFAQRVAELHGGRLEETAAGLALTLPAAY